jgi:hypothetical protein
MRHASRRPARAALRLLAGVATLAGAATSVVEVAGAQEAAHAAAHGMTREIANERSPLPFAPGERLTYTVRTSRFGGSGKATMWVEGPTAVRGEEAWPLRFDFSARVGPVKAEDRTASWFDVRRLASLRFLKHERHPLSRHDDEVELFPETRRWSAKDGSTGESPTDAPLDELSFMYFLRTLPIGSEADWRFARHYAADRNPTLVRMLKREEVETGAGRYRTVLLEMRVKNPRIYKGEGVIRINLTDDACRIPVRIESQMPVIGAAVMLLESHNLEGCGSRSGPALAVTP